MSGIVPVGNSQYISVNGTTAGNVTYGPNVSNTFRIVNQATTSTLYAAVYNNAAQATAFAKPAAGNPTVPGLIAIAPGWSENISGNFGAQNTNTVYVCVVASVSGSFDCIITPIRD
jgi:hypothetical protein